MNPSPRPLIEVSAALIFRAGKLLITQRPAETHLGGLWEFPGGKREPGETFEQCLERELHEELGITTRARALFADLTHAYPDQTVRLQFFLTDLLVGEPQPLGCAALKWIDAAGLATHAFPAADEALLHHLRRRPDLWR